MDTVENVRSSIVLVESKREGVIPGSALDKYLNKNKPNREPVSVGTGFVIDGQYIITNNHVIDKAKVITISFENSTKRHIAKLIGTDALSDIAVLRVEKGMPKTIPMKWGDSDKLRAGQEVWAMGHPRGLMYTVSKGVVSHIHRRISSGWQTVVQSDVSINQGNSGGPLMDMAGNVIAINTLILSKDGGSDGLSMSVDSKLALYVIKKLIENGRIDRPRIGTGLDYNPALGRVFVNMVEPSSAAETAGVKIGDVIIEADGANIESVDDLFDVLQYKLPYEDFKLMIMRDEVVMHIDMQLGLMEPASDTK